jgi:hypothetical protein
MYMQVNELAGHADKYTKRVNAMVQWCVRWSKKKSQKSAQQELEKVNTGFFFFRIEEFVF